MSETMDAIESRLEDMKSDERRVKFDSKLRAFRMDSKDEPPAGADASKDIRKAGSDLPVDRVISLLEEMSRRIDGLERRDRILADEIRQRARRDYHRRALCFASGLAVSSLLFLGRMISWF